jgi:D-erythro-7,8-dihydroneopterin triphosphate epimerase
MDSALATIHIKNLRLRTFIGINPEEIRNRQDVIINVWFSYNAAQAAESNAIAEAVNYRSITKQVIRHVEEDQFPLLEALTQSVLHLVCEQNGIQSARVEIDKPHALRFADSVSCSMQHP